MPKTFFDYLTQPNPEPKVHKQGKGYSTATKANYGPDRYGIWEDFTLENLKANFEHVLKKPMRRPPVRSVKDIPPEKMDIFEEESITQLAVAWNEQVLRHVFEGTYNTMCEESSQEAFRQGRIYLERNTGRGHLRGANGRSQMPDWCAYQQKAGQGPFFPNIVPGESKPAGKWKSEWINSETESLRKKAHHVMVQMTKYMWEAKTRYGFILSEEELVPVRLSAFTKEQQVVRNNNEGTKNKGQLENTDHFFQDLDEDGDDVTDEDDQDSNTPSNASYAGSTRKTFLQMEYSRIPWTASGHEVLTVNLVLWWLPVLAVQENAIKKSGTYTPLKENRRGTSPVFELDQAERDMLDKVYGEQIHQRKRKVDENEDNEDIIPPVSLPNDQKRRPNLRKRFSSRILLQETNLIAQHQSPRSPRSIPPMFRQSKKRRESTTAQLGIEKRSQHEEDNYVLSFQSNA